MFRVDLHVHYRYRMAKPSKPARMIRAAINNGLDAICFTEHSEQLSAQELAELREDNPSLRIYSGLEVSIEDQDILVYGENAKVALGAANLANLTSMAVGSNLALVLAHPRRRSREPAHIVLLHGIEAHSRTTPFAGYELVRAQAREFDEECGPLFSNSNAHSPAEMGDFANLFEELPEDDQALADYIMGLKTNWVSYRA